MPRLVWIDPSNPRSQYVTALVNDPAKPANFSVLTSGSDGAPDQALQQYVGGINSLCPDIRTPYANQANPIASSFYVGDSTQDTVAANLKAAGAKNLWINGILGGGTGDR